MNISTVDIKSEAVMITAADGLSIYSNYFNMFIHCFHCISFNQIRSYINQQNTVFLFTFIFIHNSVLTYRCKTSFEDVKSTFILANSNSYWADKNLVNHFCQSQLLFAVTKEDLTH